jgi:hypothetical protein
MRCKHCAAVNLSEFAAEIVLNFPSLENADKIPVLVFPKVVLCLQCGFAEFIVPTSELASLARESSVPARPDEKPRTVGLGS